jgi:mono/diheme cytochrome c family protein
MVNSSGKVLVAAAVGLLGAFASTGPALAADPANFSELKSSVPVTKDSIAAGRKLFATYCTQCHGTDGKAQLDVVANATDLTDPDVWSHGTGEGEIFHTIRDGAGVAMPPFKTVVKSEIDLWHLVNFVRSLWPAGKKPALQGE